MFNTKKSIFLSSLSLTFLLTTACAPNSMAATQTTSQPKVQTVSLKQNNFFKTKQDIVSYNFTSKQALSIFSNNSDLTLKSSKTTNYKFDKEVTSQYLVSASIAGKYRYLGTLTFTRETLNNGDFYYLIHYMPWTTLNRPLQIDLHLGNANNPFYEHHTYYKTPVTLTSYNAIMSSNNRVNRILPNATEYMDNKQYYMVASQSDVYKPTANLTLTYDHNKVIPTTYSGGYFQFSFPQIAGYDSEQWSVISNQSLIDWNSRPEVRTLTISDMNQEEKITSLGIVVPIYQGYNPYTPTTYWWMPANWSEQSFLRNYSVRLFNDFGIVNMYKGIERQTNGYWLSSPQSDWLHNDYHIGAGFFDTRFNTDFHRSLLSAYNSHFNDPVVLESVKEYDTFLKQYAYNHSLRTKNDGILVSDYSDFNHPTIKTHTSLNHDLAEMDFLLEYYETTGDQESKDIAQLYKQGIDDTTYSWVKSNHDLYYDRSLYGQFEGQDYPNLTLHDLKNSQNLFIKVFGKADPNFDYLIKQKTEYCNAHNIPL